MLLKPAASAPTAPPLSVAALITSIHEALYPLLDHRKGGNNQTYAIGDAGLSGFSVFFLQSPSFLDYQRRMQKGHGNNNASALFRVHRIPTTQQICNLLDPIAPAHLAPVFMDIAVGWCELTTTNGAGEVLYRNAWASSAPLTRENLIAIVAAERSRWKIENENNNTLKTKGYHFEHNYGHGKQHLAALLASLILLAFLAHTVLDLLDPR